MENRFYNAFDCESFDPNPYPSREDEYRTRFQIDRDRIIHTAAFRRLQSKTQVFLSGEYDFYRTRLTHSIEVAQIGRGICDRLNKTSDLLSPDYFIDPDLVEAACLAHDIGHPPFGHTGERSLNRLMARYGGFEGNGQTLRMLTDTIFSGSRRGMNPSRAFVDATLKYKTLYSEYDSTPDNHFLYTDQAGALDFAMGGRDFPIELTVGKVRNKFRSIECQIMDWADDSAYSLNDVADGIHAGFITLEKLERWENEKDLDEAGKEHVSLLKQAIRDGRVESKVGMKIGRFIAGCSLQEDVNFMSGSTNRYRYRLVIDDAVRAESELYKAIAFELVFKSPQLHQLDHKAEHILGKLFGVFHDRYVPEGKKGLRLLPASEEKALAEAADENERARLVCDYIASMTDGFATRTYKRLFDPEFGSIVDLI